MTHGTLIITPFVPFLSFFSQLFFLHLSQTLFSFSPLTSPPPAAFPSPHFAPPSFNYSVVLFNFPSPDILPGCVAETSDLSRGICGQHPCLLFSLFLLSSMPPFIHPSFFLLLRGSLVNTSFPPSASFLHSLVPLWTSLFSLWIPPLFLPLHSSVSPLYQLNAWLVDLLFSFSFSAFLSLLIFFIFQKLSSHHDPVSFHPRLLPPYLSLHPSSLPQIKVGIGGFWSWPRSSVVMATDSSACSNSGGLRNDICTMLSLNVPLPAKGLRLL